MMAKDLELLLATAADGALDARRRIEAAVDAGDLPPWVMDACEQWERAALAYGAARARDSDAAITMPLQSRALH